MAVGREKVETTMDTMILNGSSVDTRLGSMIHEGSNSRVKKLSLLTNYAY